MTTTALRLTIATLLILGRLALAQPAPSADGNQAVDDFNFAAWLYNTGKYGLAAEAYQAFLQAHPRHEKAPDALFGLAQAQFHQDQFKEAAASYERLRTDHAAFPQRPEVLFQLAQARVALEDPAAAAALFAEVREKHAAHYLADWAAPREAACLISLKKDGEAAQRLEGFVDAYAPADRDPAASPATKKMLERMAGAGVKADAAFLDLVERAVFQLGLARFNQEQFKPARDAFARYLKQYPSGALAEEARFRTAQALYKEGEFVKAAEAYAPLASAPGTFAPAAAFERGLSFYKAGRAKDAAQAFADMAARFPEHPQAVRARLYGGTFRYEAGDYAGAIAALQDLAAGDQPPADEAAYWIGMSRLKAGEAEAAEKLFADTLRKFPKSPLADDLRLGLADARLARNDYPGAAEAFRAFAEAAPKSEQAPRALYSAAVALHRADRYDESDKLCDAFLAAHPKHELAPQALFLGGENRFLARRNDEAAKRYRELLDRQDAPAADAARARFRLAWLHRYAKRLDEALTELERVDLKAAGETVAAEAAYLRGLCLFDLNRPAEAIRAFDAYLDAKDHTRFGDDALLKRAVAQVKTEQVRDAVKSFQRFLKDYPASELLPQARYQLAESLYGLKDYDAAAEQYTHVIDRPKADDLTPFALFGRGLCAYDREQWVAAAADFGRVADEFKGAEPVPQALYRKGRALAKLGKPADAVAAYRALVALNPPAELARAAQVAAGACLQELKQWGEAADAFRAAADKYPAGPDQARVTYELAWSLREAGKGEAALAAFRTLDEKFAADPLAADAAFHLAEAVYGEKKDGESDAQKTKRLEQARDLYAKAVARAKDGRLADKAHYRLGWCAWALGRFEDAAKEFDAVIERHPDSELVPDALYQGGQAHARAGGAAKAMERFGRLLDDARFASFEFLPDAALALADVQIAEEQNDAAVKRLKAYVEKYNEHPTAPRAYFLLGKAQYHLKRYDEAQQAFTVTAARTRSALGAEAQFYVGQVEQARRAFKQALMAYLRVQALYPDVREWVAASLFESAKCHEELGQAGEARLALEEVVKTYGGTKWAELAADRLKQK